MSTGAGEVAPITGRVRIVHERLTEMGGSEAVVEKLASVCRDPRLFVPIADPAIRPRSLADVPLTTSFVQKAYRGGSRYSHLLPLLPLGMRRADLGDAELVVISHHAFANRVRVPAGVPTLSYVHTPARWMWESRMRTGEGNRFSTLGLAGFAATQRRADRRAAQRIDTLVANSTTVRSRIQTWWGRDAVVVHPPVDVDFYRPDPNVAREDFFLLAGRLVPYKRPEVAVAAARDAGVRLVVAGDGRSRKACERSAGPLTTFLGRVDSETLRYLFQRCRALVFPGEEDFGIVPVEAQACGTPVVALGTGGALDTVQHGKTGVLVDTRGDGVQGFADAMDRFVPLFDAASVRAHAEQFSEDVFRARMAALLRDLQHSR